MSTTTSTPRASEVNIVNLQGASVGRLTLDPAVWGGPVNLRILSQAIAMYRTNQRSGTASTKTRGDVSGGGKKPFKQKHTGRARAGSTRSPLWRHGGSVFGPRPRNMHYRLPQAIRRRALLESLKGKLHDAQLVIMDQLVAEAPKTKPFSQMAKTFQVERRSVIVLDQPSETLVKSLRNLATFELCSAANLNAFDVLNADKVFVTKSAFERLESRVKESDASSN
ncbi:MAG: 50S ribosomal protein L4 [Candidatus Omnitrophica bacterium]|nr:50S ribosomal protein L4 [Candidatus Omnitrophota bacterium]